MSEAYLIEAAGEAAGVVIRERSGFRFFASGPQFASLEQRVYRRTSDATRAALALAREAANDNVRRQSWR